MGSVAVNQNAAFERPEPWAKPKQVYRVRNPYFGEFIARCEEVHGTWASFAIVEGNLELREKGYIAGSIVDVPRDCTRIEPLE